MNKDVEKALDELLGGINQLETLMEGVDEGDHGALSLLRAELERLGKFDQHGFVSADAWFYLVARAEKAEAELADLKNRYEGAK